MSLKTPWWMGTKTGQWLATHVSLFAEAWERNMHAALVEEAHVALMFARAETGVAADRWVIAFAKPELKGELERKLLEAVVNERNAVIRWVRLTSGDEAADILFKQMDRIDRGEPLT